MNAHVKRPRIATLDGIFVLDERTGFYEPETEPETQDPTWVYPFIAVAIILFCLVVWTIIS